MADVKRGPGRPKSPKKREAILDAARKLFLAHGPEVTLDAIAAEAGVAKVTVYSNFLDKDDLIDQVINRESLALWPDVNLERLTLNPTKLALHDFGVQLVSFLNSREHLGWDRLLATQKGEGARRLFEAGPGRSLRRLTQIIEHGAKGGHLLVPNAAEAAEDLYGLWIGFVSLAVRLGAREPMTDVEIEGKVTRGVYLFMRIYGQKSR